jgi:hypothetical protein
MSKKDYVKFAAILEDCPKEIEGAPREWLAIQMARVFKADNSLFSPLRFFTAAGFDEACSAHMTCKV